MKLRTVSQIICIFLTVFIYSLMLFLLLNIELVKLIKIYFSTEKQSRTLCKSLEWEYTHYLLQNWTSDGLDWILPSCVLCVTKWICKEIFANDWPLCSSFFCKYVHVKWKCIVRSFPSCSRYTSAGKVFVEYNGNR